MNLLALVKRLGSESGTVSPSQITTVSGVTDDHVADLVHWVIRANREIEMKHDDWRFRISEAEIDLTPGDTVYDVRQLVPDFQKVWAYHEPWGFGYITIDDQTYPLRFVNYPRWAGHYDVKLSQTSAGRPIAFTIDPQEKIRVYPSPSKIYKVKFNYTRLPQEMPAADASVPLMPERFHEILVYYALIHYAMSDEAQMKLQTAKFQFDSLFLQLCNDQLPDIRVSEPSWRGL